MILQKVEVVKEGVKKFDSITENFKDLVSMLSKPKVDMKIETKKQENENKKIGRISNMLISSIKQVLQDETVKNASFRVEDDEIQIIDDMINIYKEVVDIHKLKSTSIKGGYTIIIMRKK